MDKVLITTKPVNIKLKESKNSKLHTTHLLTDYSADSTADYGRANKTVKLCLQTFTLAYIHIDHTPPLPVTKCDAGQTPPSSPKRDIINEWLALCSAIAISFQKLQFRHK